MQLKTVSKMLNRQMRLILLESITLYGDQGQGQRDGGPGWCHCMQLKLNVCVTWGINLAIYDLFTHTSDPLHHPSVTWLSLIFSTMWPLLALVAWSYKFIENSHDLKLHFQVLFLFKNEDSGYMVCMQSKE